MQLAVVATLCVVTVQAASIPREHHARFLVEKDAIADELAAWKNSPAGRYAKQHGLYKESFSVNSATATNTSDDQLVRFFLSKVTAENAQRENPEATFGLSSPFSLMTEAEFIKYVRKSSTLGNGGLFGGFGEEIQMPTELEAAPALRATTLDWTTSNCVTPVKSQGSCGTCWAFASVGALETAYCLKYGSLTAFSDQQVTNCDKHSWGCDGGWPSYAYAYMRDNGGLCTEASYPYTSGSSGAIGTCSKSCTKKSFKISSITGVVQSDAGMVAAVTKQPIAVTVAAGNPQWKQYTGGVVSACSTSVIDHAVLVVGYDATSFKLKNQWGSWWGSNGYIRVKRVSSTAAACGIINTNACYPVLA